MRADRLLSMLLTLQAKRRVTAADLAVQLEVSERTIYRDVDALSFAGIPIYTQAGPNGGVFLDEGYRTALTSFTQSEIQTLILGGDHPQLQDLGLAHISEQTLLKLLAALPSAQRDEAERMRQRFYIDLVDWFQFEEPDDHIPMLQQAIWEDYEIQFTYQRRDGSVSNRLLQPYGLVAKGQRWYLVGSEDQNEMKTFRISRILDLERCENRFERRSDFDLVSYWQTSSQNYEANLMIDLSPVKIIAKIDPQARWYFTTSMPKHHEAIGDPDENGWIALSIEFSSMLSARQMILGLGDQIEVIEPLDVRNAIIETLERNLRQYSG